jgi:hypothetical protein
VISTCATAAEPAKPAPLSPDEAKYLAEYEQLSKAVDRVCALWERDLKPERLSGPLLQALIEISNKHENDLDLACGATHAEAMRELDEHQ